MASQGHNRATRVRCMSCGKVDAPARMSMGPGWIAAALWLGAGAAWFLSWYWWPTFTAVFWVVLFAAFAYTLWYFARREEACRHCGARRLEPETAAPGA